MIPVLSSPRRRHFTHPSRCHYCRTVSDIPGNHDVKALQKTAILGTAHILRKVLLLLNDKLALNYNNTQS